MEMYDWILFCNIWGEIGGWWVIYGTLSCTVVAVANGIHIENMDFADVEKECGSEDGFICWSKRMPCKIIKPIKYSLVVAILTCIASLPTIIVKTNVDRVKILYTSPQSISQIESGTLKVVDKLDKLIDKGIESLVKE